jgi:hypothetical protein
MSSCTVCGAPTSRSVVAESAATLAGVTVYLAPVPVVLCERGHRQALPGLVDELTSSIDEQVLAATRKGWRREPRCGQCAAPLTMPAYPTEVPVPVALPGGVVTVTLATRMLRCPDCGRAQLPAEADAAWRGAVEAAIDDAEGQR